jgi:hypothetical protein
VFNTIVHNVYINTTGARGTDLPSPFFSNFLFTNLFSIKISLFLSYFIFFLILTCSCQYSYNLMLTSNCMCRHTVTVDPIQILIIHKACNLAGLKIVPLLASSTFIAPYFHYVIQTRTCIHS